MVCYATTHVHIIRKISYLFLVEAKGNHTKPNKFLIKYSYSFKMKNIQFKKKIKENFCFKRN